MRSDDETVTIDVVVKRVSERAVLVETDGEDIWIPKSQIDADASEVKLEKGEAGVLTITKWIAEQKGLA
jgi:hypothetical protein